MPAVAQAVEGGAGVGTGQQRLADEDLDDVGAGVDRPPDLAGAVDHRETRPIALASIAQRRGRLDPWIREARQDRRGRGGHAVIMPCRTTARMPPARRAGHRES